MSSRGFTLIEVLVALVIVALGMAALMSAMTSAADSNVFLRDKMFAEWIALNRIEELRLQFRRPGEGKSNGEVEYAGRRWRFEQEIAKTEIPGVLRIEVNVRPSELGTQNKGQWYASMLGIVGDAVDPPRGDLPEFRRPMEQPRGPGGPGGDGDGDGDGQQPPRPEPPPDGGTPPTPVEPPPEPEQ